MNNPIDSIYEQRLAQYLAENNLTEPSDQIERQIESESKSQYAREVLSCEKPRDRIFRDIRATLDTVTLEDVIEGTILYMFSPLGVFRYETGLFFYLHATVLNLETILEAFIENDKIRTDIFGHQVIEIDNQPARDQSFQEIKDLIRDRVNVLGCQRMPSELRARLTDKQIDLLKKTNNLDSEPDIRSMTSSPMIRSIDSLMRMSSSHRPELDNPRQLSFFKDDIEIDQYKQDLEDSRKITIKQKSLNGKEMISYSIVVENYHLLLKNNIQASKLFAYILERLFEDAPEKTSPDSVITLEFDIKDYAELLGQRPDHAKRSIKQGSELLSIIHPMISDENENFDTAPLFTRITVGKVGKDAKDKGKVIVKINPDFDLTDGGETVVLLPAHSWKLNKRAWLLSHYIYSQFRADAKNIKPELNYHIKKLSLEKVLSEVNLPHPDSVEKRISQFILEPLNDAIREVNEIESTNTGGLTLRLELGDQKTPSDQIKNGYLIATLEGGEVLDRLKNVPVRKQKHLEQSRKKAEQKQARIDQAKGKQLAKLEHQEKKDQTK